MKKKLASNYFLLLASVLRGTLLHLKSPILPNDYLELYPH